MDNQIKRRVFIASGIGALIGAPFALNYLFNGKKKPRASVYKKQLDHYHELLNVPIASIATDNSFTWRISPEMEKKTKYVHFMETFFPPSLSNVASGTPELFSVVEGNFLATTTSDDNIILSGEDSLSKEYVPFDSCDRSLKTFLLLLKDNRLVQVTPKASNDKSKLNRGFVHLFAAPACLAKAKPNQPVFFNEGRLKPFTGMRTSYTIAGFDQVGEQDTVRVHFEAKNYPAGRRENAKANDKTLKTREYHSGDSWFDLKTGLLVRQVIDFHSIVTGNLGDGKMNDKSVTDFHGIMTLQLFG